jgi:hypothetical protein
MGQYGTFQRVTTAELSDAIADPRAAFEAFDRHAEGEAGGRLFHLDRAWHGVQFLLDNAGVDLDAVFYANVFDLGDDGPMGSYLRPGEVAAAAEELASVPPSTLAAHFDPEALHEAGVQPGTWLDGGAAGGADWLLDHYDGLGDFLRAAAKDGDGVLFWVA